MTSSIERKGLLLRWLAPAAVLLASCSCREPRPPPDMVALYKGNDLERATKLLLASGCVSAGAEVALLEAVPKRGTRDATAFSTAVRETGSGVCPQGQEFLTALAAAPILALFEDGRILVDTGSDGCHDSVFDTQRNEFVSFDADGNGCIDRLYAIGNVLSFSQLPAEVQTRLLDGVATVLERMLPPTAEVSSTSGFDPVAYRAEAVNKLLELIEWVNSSPSFPSQHASLYARFLTNNLPLAEEWAGCAADPIQPGAAPNGTVAKTVPLRFYVYTSRAPHSWKSLAVGEKEWFRGLYPERAGQAYPPATSTVPDATSAPTATPTAAPPGSGSSSSSQNPSGGSSWGAQIGGEDSSSGSITGASSGSILGLLSYQDGVIRDESARDDWSSRICWDVTPEEWNTLAEHMNGETRETPDWSLANHNCLSWAANNAALIGRRLPDYTSWGIPNPRKLADSLDELGHGGTFEGGTVTIRGR